MSSIARAMLPSSRRFWRRTLLGAAIAASLSVSAQASLLVIGGEMESEPMPLDLESQRHLAFNEATFSFYSDRQFDAITQLLSNQKLGLFNEDTEYAELMLGELYVNFGLPEQAEIIFNRLLKKDILAQ